MRSLAIAALVGAAACTVNGKAFGPQLGGGGASTTPSAPAASGSSSSAGGSSGGAVTMTPSDPAPSGASGGGMGTIPDVVGKDEASARAALAAAGFTKLHVDRAYGCSQNQDAPAGFVCSTEPIAGKQLPTDIEISIAISDGPDPAHDKLVVPNLVGMTLDEANAALKKAGFKGGANPDSTGMSRHGKCELHKICAQRPAAGETLMRAYFVSVLVASQGDL